MSDAEDAGSTGRPVALETRSGAADGRQFSPSTARNKDAVRAAFLAHMPMSGNLLEIASGTGEHGAHITQAAPELSWTYSDLDSAGRASQSAWIAHLGGRPLRGPYELDTRKPDWGASESSAPYDGMFCANMIHIAPFEAAIGLFAGAARLLRPGGRLMLYGPFARSGKIAASNAQFSADLKRRDGDWGVRDLDLEILPLASKNRLKLAAVIDMPANNSSVVFSV